MALALQESGPARAWFALSAAALLAAACQRTIQSYPDEFAGIGVVLRESAKGLVVSSLVEGGPAAEAGVHLGDTLKAVDGREIGGEKLASVVAKLRGVPGSSVVVTLEAEGGARDTFTLQRRSLTRRAGGYEQE